MKHNIPSTAVERYSAAPSPTKVAAAKSLHQNIRSTLGSGYDTFLQGSYRNDTGVADINDVDIVALRTTVTSTEFTGLAATYTITWERIFQDVQDTLESSPQYRGKTERGDKCITVKTGFKADVVPAITIGSASSDPIAIYSFRERSERKNYPRVHYQHNVDKHDRTGKAYKPTVRMFKKWARNWFSGTKVAPSFYVECLVYNVPDNLFTLDGAVSFFLTGDHIVDKIGKYSVVNSVAGDKDILTEKEWESAHFELFQQRLKLSLTKVAAALQATSLSEAQRYWREAFNE